MHRKPIFKKVRFDKIEPWGQNPRRIKEEKLDALAASLEELGQFENLVCWPAGGEYGEYPAEDTGRYQTGGGNMRYQAMRHRLKYKPDVKIQISLNFPENEAERIRLALRANQRFGEYDDQAVAELVDPYKEEIPLSEYAIDTKEQTPLDAIVEKFGPGPMLIEEDEIPAPEVDPVSKPGDMFDLGDHRLICGDATEAWPYEAIMEGEKADLILTDPPTNIDGPGPAGAMTDDQFIEFSIAAVDRMAENVRKGAAFYLCAGFPTYPIFLYAIRKAGFVPDAVLVWIKAGAGISPGDYKARHGQAIIGRTGKRAGQPILYGWNGGKHYFQDQRFEADILEVPPIPARKSIHPEQKPLGLFQRFIQNSSKPGDLVLDPFGGSGTALIGSDREGRRARIIEKDPIFADVIIRRYAAGGGATEEEIRATRKNVRPKPARKDGGK